MITASTSAWPAVARYAREVAARVATEQARKAHDSEIRADSARVLETPAFKGAETAKTQARAKLEQVRERLRILRKLYAGNPREMARALTQLFKELKAAVKAYKEAGGQEFGVSASAAAGVLGASTPAASGGKAERGGEGEASSPDEAEAASAVAQVPVTADEVAGAVRDLVGRDGLEFIKEVRDLARVIGDVLQTSRGQAAVMARSRETDEAFEDADKAIKDLNKEMESMEREIRHNAPAAGTCLSIVA